MKLAELTWQDVDALDREIVVLIPTGSLEQHGPHLPLFTDSILVTAAAEAIEQQSSLLLTPTLWMGASSHHMAFSGTISADFGTYISALQAVIDSLAEHGFRRFFVLNGHGGNNSPNDMALRELKADNPNLMLAVRSYYSFIPDGGASVLEGPIKSIKHACEAEASLMLHLAPQLVRREKLRDDGLKGPIEGGVHHFDEVTEEGSYGYASFASAEKGKQLLERTSIVGCRNELGEAVTDHAGTTTRGRGASN